MGSVLVLPGVQVDQPRPDEPLGLNLSFAEVQEAAGGYKRPADQLQELHRRGFARAYIPTVGRKRVVLERAHYDAVVRGQFAMPAAAGHAGQRPTVAPDRAGLREFFQKKRKQ